MALPFIPSYPDTVEKWSSWVIHALISGMQRPRAGLIFLIVTLGDILTTELALRAGMIEANPVVAAVMDAHGRLAMYLVRFVVSTCVLLTVVQLTARYPRVWRSIYILNWMVGIVVTFNFVQLFWQ